MDWKILLKGNKDELGKVSTTARKCPFCAAVNATTKQKCRKCNLSLPQYPDWKSKGEGKTYQISLKDTRSSFKRLADYMELIPSLFIVIPLLLQYFGKGSGKKDYGSEFLISLIPIGAAALYFMSGGSSAVQSCQNCGKIMVIKIPLRKAAFPQAVKCWNCGAIHKIEWDTRSRKTMYAPRPDILPRRKR